MFLSHFELCVQFHVYQHIDSLMPDKWPVLTEPQEKLRYLKSEYEWFIPFIDDLEEELHEKLHLREGPRGVADFVRVISSILPVFIQFWVQACAIH